MPNNRPTVFWEDARVENNGFGKDLANEKKARHT